MARWMVWAVAAALPLAAAAQAQFISSDRARLAEAIAQAARPMSLANGTLEGDGGAWLAGKLAGADIIMIGETHGTGDVAQAVGMLVDALPADRPLAYALEMGPTGAAVQESLLRDTTGKHEAYMADPRRAISFAFLNLREEAALARKILTRTRQRSGALWGLDQEFATSAPLLLDRLDSWARSPAQKAAIATAREKGTALTALTQFRDDVYAPLDKAFARGPDAARRLLADMRLSSEIYRLQDSAANASNRMREEHMKRNFLARWRKVRKAPPRVVMKFGAYHLTAGLSPTQAPALGGFVNALALIEGRRTFSVMIVCGPDGERIDFRGKVAGCRADFQATAGMFYPSLAPDGPTLIDTAPLRLLPGSLRRQGISEDMRTYINSYDAIIILKGGRAATPFAPPLPSFFQPP